MGYGEHLGNTRPRSAPEISAPPNQITMTQHERPRFRRQPLGAPSGLAVNCNSIDHAVSQRANKEASAASDALRLPLGSGLHSVIVRLA
jgi:hypothetical protein